MAQKNETLTILSSWCTFLAIQQSKGYLTKTLYYIFMTTCKIFKESGLSNQNYFFNLKK